jgi:hypothetical protein
MVDAQIRITGAREVEDYLALANILSTERELAGRVTTVPAPTGPNDLGAGIQMITVALSSGGVGAVLGQVITEFLRNRRSDIKVIVTRGDQSVEVDAKRVGDARAVLERVLQDRDGA